MSDENELSADEKAYFETQGNPPPADENAVEDADDGEDGEGAELEASDEADEGEGEQQERRPEKVKTVPHQALHAERTKRQEIERQLAAEREARARLDERVRLINEAIAKQNTPEPAKIPTPEEDPIGALKYTQEQLAQIAERERASEQQRAQEAELSRLDNAYRTDWASHIANQPDAVDAYNHFTTVLDKHFELRGVADPAMRQQLVMNEEREIAAAAFRSGKSPAQIIYEQAKFYGYSPKVAAPTAQEGNRAVEQIERKQKAMPAARSMSAAGSSAGDAELTPQALISMSDDEFAELSGRLSDSRMRKLLGG
jgi:hypothetical protein